MESKMENEPAQKSKKRFPLALKLTVISRAEKIGNTAAAQEFGVSSRSIRRWKIKYSEQFYRMQQSKITEGDNIFHLSNLESDLEFWIKGYDDRTLPLSMEEICSKAKLIAEQRGIIDFKGDQQWFYSFMKRKKLYTNSKPLKQQLNENCIIQRSSFLDFVIRIIQQQNLTNAQIISMREIPFSFSSIYGEESNRMPDLISSNENLSFSCIISCAADGAKLKPFIIFKSEYSIIPKGNFPSNVMIRSNNKGRICGYSILDWLWEVWRKRKGGIFDPRGILIIDSVHEQLFESIKGECEKACSTVAVIPTELTDSLNPLSPICNAFQMEMMKHYKEWFNNEHHLLTKESKIEASAEEIARWVSDSWRSVKVSAVINGFTETNIVANSSINLDAMREEGFKENETNYFQNLEGVSDHEFMKHISNSDSDESEFEGF